MKSFLAVLTIFISFSCFGASLEAFFLSSQQRILFTGENHKDDINREKLTVSLSSFRASGGDTLGLEMIESHKQHLLDSYLSFAENSEEELSHYLTLRWQYNTRSYMKLISTARELGLGLLAIDLNRQLWPQETALFPVPPEISKIRAAREEHMAKILCRANYQKIIVIIGSFHSKKRFLPEQLIEECSLRSATFNLSTL